MTTRGRRQIFSGFPWSTGNWIGLSITVSAKRSNMRLCLAVFWWSCRAQSNKYTIRFWRCASYGIFMALFRSFLRKKKPISRGYWYKKNLPLSALISSMSSSSILKTKWCQNVNVSLNSSKLLSVNPPYWILDANIFGTYVIYGELLCTQYLLCDNIHTFFNLQACSEIIHSINITIQRYKQLYRPLHSYKGLYTAIQTLILYWNQLSNFVHIQSLLFRLNQE